MSTVSSSPISRRLAYGATLAVAVLYLATRQQQFTSGSLVHLRELEFGGGVWRLHPHHLLLQPLLQTVWWLWSWFEWPARAVIPVQTFQAIVSVVALAVFWRVLRRLDLSVESAAVWWTALATSHLVWHQSTQAEGAPLQLLFSLLMLWWAVRLATGPPTTAKERGRLIAVMVGAVLVHQALVAWVPLLSWMLARQSRSGRRWREGAITLATTGVILLILYVAAGVAATGSFAPASLANWLTGHADGVQGPDGPWNRLFGDDEAGGLATSFLSGRPLGPYVGAERPADAAFAVRLVPFILLGLGLLVGFVSLGPAWSRSDGRRRRALAHVVVLVVAGALVVWWMGPNADGSWAPVLPGLLLLAAVGWSVPWPRLAGGRIITRVLLVTILATYNLVAGALPRHRSQDARQPLMVFLARQVQPGDVVILPQDRVWLVATYFQPDRPIHGIPGPGSDRLDPAPTVRGEAVAAAVAALAAGRTVFISSRAWDLIGPRLEEGFGPLDEPVPVLEFDDDAPACRVRTLLAVRPSRR